MHQNYRSFGRQLRFPEPNLWWLKWLKPNLPIFLTIRESATKAYIRRSTNVVDQVLSHSEQLAEDLAEKVLYQPKWVNQALATVNTRFLDRHGLVSQGYVLVEKGARAAHVNYTLPLYRLTGKETRMERDTLYSCAALVVAKDNEVMAMRYGKVAMIRSNKKIYPDSMTLELSDSLPDSDELVSMGYFNRSLCADYLSISQYVRKLKELYERIEFFGQATEGFQVSNGELSSE
jgi:hypothetical protein